MKIFELKLGEKLMIGDDIVVKPFRIFKDNLGDKHVSIGFDAPLSIRIDRAEIHATRLYRENHGKT